MLLFVGLTRAQGPGQGPAQGPEGGDTPAQGPVPGLAVEATIVEGIPGHAAEATAAPGAAAEIAADLHAEHRHCHWMCCEDYYISLLVHKWRQQQVAGKRTLYPLPCPHRWPHLIYNQTLMI